jgi:hypothetical protein
MKINPNLMVIKTEYPQQTLSFQDSPTEDFHQKPSLGKPHSFKYQPMHAESTNLEGFHQAFYPCYMPMATPPYYPNHYAPPPNGENGEYYQPTLPTK